MHKLSEILCREVYGVSDNLPVQEGLDSRMMVRLSGGVLGDIGFADPDEWAKDVAAHKLWKQTSQRRKKQTALLHLRRRPYLTMIAWLIPVLEPRTAYQTRGCMAVSSSSERRAFVRTAVRKMAAEQKLLECQPRDLQCAEGKAVPQPGEMQNGRVLLRDV